MASIADLTVKDDGSLEVNLATLMITAPIVIVPNDRKVKDSEPSVAVIADEQPSEAFDELKHRYKCPAPDDASVAQARRRVYPCRSPA